MPTHCSRVATVADSVLSMPYRASEPGKPQTFAFNDQAWPPCYMVLVVTGPEGDLLRVAQGVIA